MTGTPLFSGPLAPNQPSIAPPVAPAAPAVAAPAVAAPVAQPGMGKPMFSGPLVPQQPQQAVASNATPDAGPPVDTNFDQATSQGVAGVNEGASGLLSAPNQLLKAIFSVGPNIVNAMGGHAAQPDWLNALPDAGKNYDQIVAAIGANRAPTNNPIDKLMRGMGQGVGGALLPEIGLESAAANGAVKIGNVLKGLVPAATSGAGGQLAENIAPGNPVAEIAGQTLGAMVPGSTSTALRSMSGGAKLPTLEELVSPGRNADLAATKTAAYNAVDNSGARYTPQSYDGLVNDIVAKATADNLNPQIHTKAAAFIDQLRNAPQGTALTLTQLDQLRQQASRDLMDHDNSHFGKIVIDSIDNLINNAGPATMVTGNGPAAADLINAARAANTRLSKTNQIDDAIQHALANAGASGSGGNVNNALRQQMKPFINDPNVKRGFTPDQIDQARKVIEGTPVENGLRLVGKLSPTGNGLMAALNLGAALFTHGMSTAIPVAGALAKGAADNMTKGNVARLRESVSGRVATKTAAGLTDRQRQDVLAAIMGAAAGQR